MSVYFNSLKREIGKNTGKWLSNLLFKDAWSTPYKLTKSSDATKIEKKYFEKYKFEEINKIKSEINFLNKQVVKSNKLEAYLLEKNRILAEKAQEQENALEIIDDHNNFIQSIQNLHSKSSKIFNWNEFSTTPSFEYEIEKQLKDISPSFKSFKQLKDEWPDYQFAICRGDLSYLKLLSIYVYNNIFNDNLNLNANNNNLNAFILDIKMKEYGFEKANSNYKEDEEALNSNYESLKNELYYKKHKLEELESTLTFYDNVHKKMGSWFKSKEHKSIIKEFEQSKNEYDQFEKHINDQLEAIKLQIDNIQKMREALHSWLNISKSIVKVWEKAIDQFTYHSIIHRLKNEFESGNKSLALEFALRLLKPFDFHEALNIDYELDISKEAPIINVFANSCDVIPTVEPYLVYTKTVRYRNISEDKLLKLTSTYLSSLSIRYANEFFIFIPYNARVLINIYDIKLNSTTGVYNNQLLISTLYYRKDFEKRAGLHLDPLTFVKSQKTNINPNANLTFNAIQPIELADMINNKNANIVSNFNLNKDVKLEGVVGDIIKIFEEKKCQKISKADLRKYLKIEYLKFDIIIEELRNFDFFIINETSIELNLK